MAPPAPRSVREIPEELIKAFEEHKLGTTHQDDRAVVHKIRDSEYVWIKKERIGSGASGAVWLQEKEVTGDLRAVKMLVKNPQMDLCHSRELLALVKLKDHPRLFVEFLGWYENHENMFLALEYIEGGDLSKYIAEGGPKPILEVKDIAKQILEGLEVLHSLSIYHRDLKPQNILVASLDPIWVKITDFGVSKRENTASSLRSQVGTYGYMAPELLGYVPIKGKTRYRAYALDMWSLGILLHEIATCKMPFCSRPTDPEQESDPDPDSDSDSELNYVTASTWNPVTSSLDEEFLKKYCSGHAEFPVDLLEKSNMCRDKEGIAFLKALLVAAPKNRLTAARALKTPWLDDCNCHLKEEFRLLGVDLDLNGGKEPQKEFVDQFFSDSVERSVSSLLSQAAANGYCLAVKKLLDSGPINDSDIRESLRLAMVNKQFKAAGILLRNGRIIEGQDEEKVLHLAFEARRVEVVDTLLQHDMPYNTTFPWTKLYPAVIRSRDLDILEIVIRRTDINLQADDHGRMPLQLAAQGGHADVVKLLLDRGADVNASDQDGQRSLSYAARGGHADVVKLLLDHGADVNATAWVRGSLSYAAEGGHVDVVELLLNHGADVNATVRGRGILSYAAGGGHVDLVKLLLGRGADVNTTAWDRGSLSYAAEGGHVDVVELLLNHGADVNATVRGRRIFSYAAGGGHVDVVKLLLNHGADVNTTAWDRGSLSYAAEGGHADVVKLLLDHGADVNATIWVRGSLSYAAEGGHADVVELLLDHGADVNATVRGRGSLSYAAGGGHADVVKLLLDRGAHVNASDQDGQRSLSYAAEGGHAVIVKLLLDYGAHVNEGDQQHRGSLSYAAKGGHADVVELLLNHGADVNATVRGRGSLSYAAEGGHAVIVELLLNHGADVNATVRGQGSLSYAAGGGHAVIVELLLNHGADVNATVWGRGSLSYAAGGGHADVVKLLLDRGADVNASDQDGRGSLSYAAGGEHADVVKLLLDHGADVNASDEDGRPSSPYTTPSNLAFLYQQAQNQHAISTSPIVRDRSPFRANSPYALFPVVTRSPQRTSGKPELRS